MGEYIRNIKLGTCEDLYYTTFNQLINTTIFNEQEKREFLKIDSGYRFRFPFPDENSKIGEYDNFERGVLLDVPVELGVELSHRSIFSRIGFKYASDSSKEFGVEFPCVFSKDCKDSIKGIKVFKWNRPEYMYIEIVQQKYTTRQGGEKLVTIARCPYCGGLCQLSKEEILKLSVYYNEILLSDINDENLLFISKILKIALSGYNLQPVASPGK